MNIQKVIFNNTKDKLDCCNFEIVESNEHTNNSNLEKECYTGKANCG